MAGFKMHVSVAAMASGLSATALMGSGQVDHGQVILLFTAGTVGGILPDIDSDNSTPLSLAFTIFSVAFAFLSVFALWPRFSIAELGIVWLVAYLIGQIGLFRVFADMTVHRGIIHSIPAGFVMGLLALLMGYYLFGIPVLVAWWMGIFVMGGFFVHLLLDELYSLNLLSPGGVKHSFGTAFKLYSSIPLTAIWYGLAVGLFLLAPDHSQFWQSGIVEFDWQAFHSKLLPQEGWFGMP
ncbi:MAG: metal-dependent hydrolase [Magnetococcales bacterium]|nr:metal-dependent hydrolase [Magnetococcales bacterium]